MRHSNYLVMTNNATNDERSRESTDHGTWGYDRWLLWCLSLSRDPVLRNVNCRAPSTTARIRFEVQTQCKLLNLCVTQSLRISLLQGYDD